MNGSRFFGLSYKDVPLSSLLVFPFLIQIFAAVSLVGYLSFKNAQLSTNALAEKLSDEVSARVNQHLDTYLVLPHQVAQISVDALNTNLVGLSDFDRAGRYFWKQLQVYETISFLGYYLNNGEGVAAQRWPPNSGISIVEHSLADGKDYNYSTDSNGNRKRLLDATPYYAPSDDWFIDAVKANRPIWSRIYTADGFPGYVAASAAYPLRDKNKKIIGVLSVDLLLSRINRFLQSIKISPNGRIFVVERDGMLIGNSGSALNYLVKDKHTQRLKAINCDDVYIRRTSQFLTEKFVDLRQIKGNERLVFDLNGSIQFVKVIPWKDAYGLDWLIVVTIPESDFMGQINDNNRTTVLLCFAALMTATLLGMITSRWIAQPIQRLNLASQAIASGDLQQNIRIKGIRELQELSQAFNRMAEQLRDWLSLLESRVAERTIQLDEAKQAAENAREVAIAANQAKSAFLANMSHELRTPMNAILGFAQLMNRDDSLSNSQKENLGVITRSGEHLLALINDVLDMSKIEAGRLSIHKNDFNLHDLLESIVEMLSLRTKLKDLALMTNYAKELPQYINTDEKKLRQVLLNLLGNAVKFTESGFVSLDVEIESAVNTSLDSILYLKFVVEDSGPGIAAHELPTLFEPFVQTEVGRKSEQGTGLGLSISRKFVELMGGTLQVSSILGQGAKFEFTIPVGVSAAVVAAQPNRMRKVIGLAQPHPQYRILVVDDHRENRQLLIKLLEPIGFEVREASNGEEAIACWENWKPHLIWMDMRMPVVNGFEATRHIKAHADQNSTVIIALTASALNEEIPKIKSVGCNDFIRKPFLECEIFDKIGQYLNLEYTYDLLVPSASESIEPLTTEALAVMSPDWLAALHEAAVQLDPEVMIELINQIPSEYAELRKSLQSKVDNYDFDHILAVIQQVETRE